uniref:ATP-dependent DNA helicase n=1 Tax=Amphimedon queenslandica TaxID=400682 RepID=A0A1X7VGC9_AMPQE
MQGEVERDISQEDIDDNTTLITNPCDDKSRNNPAALSYRFESAAKKEVIAPDEYRSLMRGLNDKQRPIAFFHRKWCKEAILNLKKGIKIKPYYIFLSGPGGVGKSHVIRIIQSDSIKLLKLSGFFEPDEVIVLLTAPTGVAAFNIGEMTLHSSLMLGCKKYGSYKSLSHDKANTLRLRLAKLNLLIIDDISMVGSNMLFDVHRKLNEILVQPHDVIFGNLSILAVGDFYQLPPVGQSSLFGTMSQNSLACLYGSGSLWKENFKMLELDQVIRQRGDTNFVKLLGRVRTGSCTNDDTSLRRS